ncbi:MAG: LruC domain-containing protein [Bacteroidales bacterium]
MKKIIRILIFIGICIPMIFSCVQNNITQEDIRKAIDNNNPIENANPNPDFSWNTYKTVEINLEPKNTAGNEKCLINIYTTNIWKGTENSIIVQDTLWKKDGTFEVVEFNKNIGEKIEYDENPIYSKWVYLGSSVHVTLSVNPEVEKLYVQQINADGSITYYTIYDTTATESSLESLSKTNIDTHSINYSGCYAFAKSSNTLADPNMDIPDNFVRITKPDDMYEDGSAIPFGAIDLSNEFNNNATATLSSGVYYLPEGKSLKLKYIIIEDDADVTIKVCTDAVLNITKYIQSENRASNSQCTLQVFGELNTKGVYNNSDLPYNIYIGESGKIYASRELTGYIGDIYCAGELEFNRSSSVYGNIMIPETGFLHNSSSGSLYHYGDYLIIEGGEFSLERSYYTDFNNDYTVNLYASNTIIKCRRDFQALKSFHLYNASINSDISGSNGYSAASVFEVGFLGSVNEMIGKSYIYADEIYLEPGTIHGKAEGNLFPLIRTEYCCICYYQSWDPMYFTGYMDIEEDWATGNDQNISTNVSVFYLDASGHHSIYIKDELVYKGTELEPTPNESSVYLTSEYSVAFEDLWPSYGDYDVNDIVVHITNVQAVIDQDNNVKSVNFLGGLNAVGATYDIGFSLMLDEVFSSQIASVSYNGNESREGVGEYNGTTEIAEIPFISSAHKYYKNESSTPLITLNTLDTDRPRAVGPEINITINFVDNSQVSIDDLALSKLNYFIIIKGASYNSQRRLEIHRKGFMASELANHNYDSLYAMSSSDYLYASYNGFPWGIIVPDSLNGNMWEWPDESIRIDIAYDKFLNWINTNGSEDENWYLYPTT